MCDLWLDSNIGKPKGSSKTKYWNCCSHNAKKDACCNVLIMTWRRMSTPCNLGLYSMAGPKLSHNSVKPMPLDHFKDDQWGHGSPQCTFL